MALRVFQFAATIPAGTEETAPVTVDLDIDNWELESIDLEVPPGPAGLMGFQVWNNGVPWLPASPGQWVVWDDVQQSWLLSGQPNASGWSVVGYNTGTFDHAVTVRMHVNPPTDTTTVAAPTPITFIQTAPAPTPAVALG